MEHIIDIQLVKEQLRLLGHEVEDGVIIDFVRGLNKGPAGANQTERERDAADQDVRPQQQPAAAAVDTSTKSKAARAPASVADRDTDAAPSKLQQAPDQQSPKRPPATAAPEQNSPAVPMPQHAALDQRCRNFLSRCSDTPSPQQEQVQQQQQHHHQQQQQLPLQPVLLQVLRVQDSVRRPVAAGSSSPQSGSSSGSSELLLGDAGNDTDSTDGSTHGLGARIAASWTQPPTTQQYQQLAQRGAELDSRDSGGDSDSDGSSLVLEAEGSKFLLHQAATMQRVRARLAATMAGYAAAASAQESSGANQLQASASAAAAAARLGAGSSDASSASNSSAADSSSELPRFGFRPGYTPVGIHMPTLPSAAAVEALAAARTLRQQVSMEGGSAAGAPMAAGGSSKAATVPPLKLDLPLNMQSLTSAVNRLHEQQQQQQAGRKGHSRVDPLLLPGGVGGALHPIASPGKAACASSVAAARASASIIGETPPCMASAAAGHKPRQSPRVDPLYLAPSSPRRSNPATPRSSPALSPAPVAAALSAAAGGPGALRSPAGIAPAAAVGAGRSGCSAGVKQSLTFSSGSRGAAGARGSAHHHHQQQQHLRGEAGGAGRRASSAPPTLTAGAPGGALRGPSVGGAGGSGASGGCYSARRSAAVSHESLYCQRLSSACGSQRSTVAPGVRKTDRVARFQQMQQQWDRDRFLSSGAGGAAKKSAGQ